MNPCKPAHHRRLPANCQLRCPNCQNRFLFQSIRLNCHILVFRLSVIYCLAAYEINRVYYFRYINRFIGFVREQQTVTDNSLKLHFIRNSVQNVMRIAFEQIAKFAGRCTLTVSF